VSYSAAPSRDKEGRAPTHALSNPWEQGPTLQSQLYAIVAEAAEAGSGARLVVATPEDRPRVLISVRGNRHPWRAPALAVLERGETMSCDGTIAAPIYGAPGVRGALLLYHDSARPLPPGAGQRLALAHAARVELALTLSSSGLTATRCAVDALHHALAAHDEQTARHAIRVRALTHTLGQAMDVAGHTLLEWEWAALLHDVGKIAVPPPLLRKPGPLDDDEWALIRGHPSAGERIVRTVPALRAVSTAVRHHHERWDGAGYPDRLSGHAIPLAARIIALVDAYETMRTGRPYRASLTRDEARDELRRAAGAQFDPGLLSWLPALMRHDIDL